MKKVLLSLAIVSLLGFGFVSCKKSCTCTINGLTTTDENIDEAHCKAANTGAQIAGGKCAWE